MSHLAGLQTDSSMTPFTDELTLASQASEVPSTEMRRAAMQIAQQCLRCWDGTLEICPGTDTGGAKAGIWRQKFDGVRCAALLLAFHKLNRNLQRQSGRPGMSAATTLRLMFFCTLKQSVAARAESQGNHLQPNASSTFDVQQQQRLHSGEWRLTVCCACRHAYASLDTEHNCSSTTGFGVSFGPDVADHLTG